jgi:hypothetical protein
MWEVALNEATAAYAIERSHHVQEANQANARAAVALEEAEQERGRFADHERQIAPLGEQVATTPIQGATVFNIDEFLPFLHEAIAQGFIPLEAVGVLPVT